MHVSTASVCYTVRVLGNFNIKMLPGAHLCIHLHKLGKWSTVIQPLHYFPKSNFLISNFLNPSGHCLTISRQVRATVACVESYGTDRQWNVWLWWHPESVTRQWPFLALFDGGLQLPVRLLSIGWRHMAARSIWWQQYFHRTAQTV